MRVTFFFLSFVLFLLPSQSWAVATVFDEMHQYDEGTQQHFIEKTAFDDSGCTYDSSINFHNCCSKCFDNELEARSVFTD